MRWLRSPGGGKNAYRGRKNFWITGCFFVHELHELTRRLCATGMATGSVALICTNARMGLFLYDDNGDNLRQLEVVLGATEMPRNIIAHELHKNS